MSKKKIMKIGIVGLFNPYTVIDYLSKENKLKVTGFNDTASSVNVLVKSLLEAGQNVVVFTGNYEEYSDSILFGEQITIYIIGLKIRYRYLLFFIYSLIISRRIEGNISKHISDIDLLHAQWTYEFAYASRKFVEKIPVICTVRDWAPLIYSSVSGIKAKSLWIQKKMISKKVLNNLKIHFVSNSYYTQQCILNIRPDYDVPIIFNSIEDSYILRYRENYPKQNIFISITPSVDDVRKNCDKLIEAFSIFHYSYPEAKLIMVGEINYNGSLYKKWKKQELLQNVEFWGYVDHFRLIKILDNVTCLVHSSVEETFGNILLEGMARRIPIIGGENAGAVPYVLKQGLCGCLCDVTNPVSIADAMRKIIVDTTYTKSIINNATSALLNEYAGSIVAQKHIQFYNTIKESQKH